MTARATRRTEGRAQDRTRARASRHGAAAAWRAPAACALAVCALLTAASAPAAPQSAPSASVPSGASPRAVAPTPAPAPADRTRERAPARAQGPASATAEKDGLRATLTLRAPAGWQPGAPIEGEVTVALPPGARLEPPQLGETLGAWDVRDVRFERGTAPDTALLRFTLRVWEAGPQTVPAIPVVAVAADGQRVEVAPGPVEVEIASLLAADTPLTELAAPIRGPVEIAAGRWWWYVLAALGAGLTLWLVAWLFRRGRAEAPEPPLPPHDWALRELERLEAERLPARGEFGRFFTRLSDIARHYVEQRWGISAPEQTTQEFLRAARAHPELAGGHEGTLGRFLRAADMVKFAAVRPAAEECDGALDLIRGFVRASAPPLPAPDSAPAPASAHAAATRTEGATP